MSRMITSGASKPNGAGLPMFSLRIRWPSASSRAACRVPVHGSRRGRSAASRTARGSGRDKHAKGGLLTPLWCQRGSHVVNVAPMANSNSPIDILAVTFDRSALAGGRAPLAIAKAFHRRCLPLAVALAGTVSGAGAEFAVVLRFRLCGCRGFRRLARRGAAAAFGAPGRLAPAAMPEPLTAGFGASVTVSVTVSAGNSSGADSAGSAPPPVPCRLRCAGLLGRAVSGVLRTLGAAADGQTLHVRLPAASSGAPRLRVPPVLLLACAAAGCRAGLLGRRGAWRRTDRPDPWPRRCRGLGCRPVSLRLLPLRALRLPPSGRRRASWLRRRCRVLPASSAPPGFGAPPLVGGSALGSWRRFRFGPESWACRPSTVAAAAVFAARSSASFAGSLLGPTDRAAVEEPRISCATSTTSAFSVPAMLSGRHRRSSSRGRTGSRSQSSSAPVSRASSTRSR